MTQLHKISDAEVFSPKDEFLPGKRALSVTEDVARAMFQDAKQKAEVRKVDGQKQAKVVKVA